jgi:hypothetical protein
MVPPGPGARAESSRYRFARMTPIGRALAETAPRRAPGALLCTLLAALLLVLLPAGAEAKHEGKDRSVRHVLFVGNNWDGTVDVINPRGNFSRISRINVIPDRAQREFEIAANPVDFGFYMGVFALVGEGHHQYADDMYTSKDGRILAISRPSFRDVVAFDLTDCRTKKTKGEPDVETCKQLWRFQVAGNRSDHMAVSPDGKHLAVSASTGNVVHILKLRNGRELGRFPSGDSPHENVYSKDGERIFHASIGRVYTPTDQNLPGMDTTKGDRRFQIVDAKTNKIVFKRDMGQELRKAGYPGMDAAVRPMTFSRNERFVYFQVSFFHGFVEYDLRKKRVRRVAELPNLVPDTPREQYLLDSAHHGIAMSGKGNKLCVAGTMSDYAAIVARKSFRYKLIKGGKKPYWSTTTNNGKLCFVSWSGSDRISAIRFRNGKELARVRVGLHPQRMRMGNARASWLRARGQALNGSGA